MKPTSSSTTKHPLLELDDTPPRAEWIVTFGDMMSLLLTFFVMLVAISQIRPDGALQSLVASLRQRFGGNVAVSDAAQKLGEKKRPPDVQSPPESPAAAGPLRPRNVARPLPAGVIHFAPGQIELTVAQHREASAIAALLAGKLYQIELRGHAAPDPRKKIADAPADRWELAYRRCRATLDVLVAFGIDPRRIRLTVSGEYEPARPGVHPLGGEGRDRVEISLLSDRIERLEVTP